MTLEERARAHKDNYGSRRGEPVKYVILHTTEGTAKSALAWFADPRARASSHYLISRTGVLWNIVDEEDAAWHAGNLLYNRQSVGIELEGHSARMDTFTDAMMGVLGGLVFDVCERYSIPMDRRHVIGHHEVPHPQDPTRKGGKNGHTDPGRHFPWDRLMADLKRRKEAKC